MSENVQCAKCNTMILPATARRTGGLCMACKQGIRQSIENSKRYHEERRKYDPFRELWKSLVYRVSNTELGYAELNADEKLYFSVQVLEGEVYNGGIHQFFWNSSGDLYRDAVSGLESLAAYKTLDLVIRASRLLLPDGEPPLETAKRREALIAHESEVQDKLLAEIDCALWGKPDKLNERLRRFAIKRGLVTPFIK